jgi:hypothetical protein
MVVVVGIAKGLGFESVSMERASEKLAFEDVPSIVSM